jgi:hypothetical protein
MSAPTHAQKSLVTSAEQKQLPLHQYTDADTVKWIAAHRPDFPAGLQALRPNLSPAVRRCLTSAIMPARWFPAANRVDSLHGQRHGARTAVFAAVLADELGLDEDTTASLVVAAAVHDCRRLHDKDDRDHGLRASNWLRAHCRHVYDHFALPVRREQVRRSAAAVRLHNVPYSSFTDDDETVYAEAATLTDLLKAADALDRYRLPKLKWWPNRHQLRLTPAPDVHAFAFGLVVATEWAFVNGEPNETAFVEALAHRGLD